jgi:glycosyltransferase involved in cell wall biosynthesis
VSLKEQTYQTYVVVVDDGSTDRTRKIASESADFVFSLPHHEENWGGRPELARVFNAGFAVLAQKQVDYVMISGADCIYPSKYVENVINDMEKKQAVLASGIAEGERYNSLSPRGSGRIFDGKWFRAVGFKYPENYGFEVYPVFKALSQGEKVIIFPSFGFKLSRRTKISTRRLYLWGKGMKALNYWWPYAIGRAAVLAGIKCPSCFFAMLKGYLSSVPSKYEDLADFVPKFQRNMVIRRLKEIVMNQG